MRIKTKNLCRWSAIVCVALAAITTSARADVLTFQWTLAGPDTNLGGFGTPGSGSGTLTVTTGPNGDIITAMTGTLGGNQLTLFAPETFGGNDNLLFPIGTEFNRGTSVVDLDTSGIAVSTVLGDFHIFADGSPFSKGTVSGNDIFESGPNGFGVGTLAITAAVPEASTWAMMILGFCGLGFMACRRRSTPIAA